MSRRRNPRNYDGTDNTQHHIKDLTLEMKGRLFTSYQQRPDLLLISWPEVIGPKLAPMTEALSFADGVLTVRVKNASLYSLLHSYERPKLLSALQKRFPKTNIKTIQFRIG